jgi:hypothetical protein
MNAAVENSYPGCMWFKRPVSAFCTNCNERRPVQPGPKDEYGICETCHSILPIPARPKTHRRTVLKSVLGAIGAAALGKIEYLPGLIRRLRPARQVVALRAHAAGMATMSATLQGKVLRATANNGDNPVEEKPA